MSATSTLLADDRVVYRGLRNSNWSRHGKVMWKAFMLRPATDEFPIERELSLGKTPESAVDELRENHGVAKLPVGEVHALPHGLQVRENPEDSQKADLYGLPLHSKEPAQIDLAITIASDLAGISEFLPPTPKD